MLVIGLGGYVVYDKVLSNEETPEEETTNDIVEEELPDKEYFDEYLYAFLPINSASNFMKNIDSFSDNEITLYLYWYYVNQGLQKKIKSDQEKNNEENPAKIYYTIAKSDFDTIVYKMFGTKDYAIVETQSETGIVKIDDNTYQVRSKATGWYAPQSEMTNFKVDNTSAVVEYNLLGSGYDGTEGQIVGNLKFYLTKNDGNWNITKIEYSK